MKEADVEKNKYTQRAAQVRDHIAPEGKGKEETSYLTVFQFPRNLEVIPSTGCSEMLCSLMISLKAWILYGTPHIQHTPQCCKGPVVPNRFFELQKKRDSLRPPYKSELSNYNNQTRTKLKCMINVSIFVCLRILTCLCI